MKFIGDLLYGDDAMIRSDEKTWESFQESMMRSERQYMG